MLSICVFAFLLSACKPSYITISDDTAVIDIDKAIGADYSQGHYEKIGKAIVNNLHNRNSPISSLIIAGNWDMVVDYFEPIAEYIIELEIPSLGSGGAQLSQFTNLQILRINYAPMSMSNGGAARVFSWINDLPSLEELYIQPFGEDAYVFYSNIRNSGLSLTINGLSIAEWNPSSDFDDSDKYAFMVGEMRELVERDDLFTTSSAFPTNINGKILVADKNENEQMIFKSYLETTGSEFYASEINECSAVI